LNVSKAPKVAKAPKAEGIEGRRDRRPKGAKGEGSEGRRKRRAKEAKGEEAKGEGSEGRMPSGAGRTLQIVDYDPRWPELFDAEATRIRGALGSIARHIEHNGSTAVPGLAAKPVIDIQISVDALQPIDVYLRPLVALGYTHVPHADDAFCPFLHPPPSWPHTHHIHVVRLGGPEEQRTLAFRDYLRAHAEVAGEYETLKRRLASTFAAGDADARERYAHAKTEFIERVIASALAAGYPRAT